MKLKIAPRLALRSRSCCASGKLLRSDMSNCARIPPQLAGERMKIRFTDFITVVVFLNTAVFGFAEEIVSTQSEGISGGGDRNRTDG